MQSGTGVFIVIEGTDGSGKGTQFQKLAERLVAEGYDVATFDFPRYDDPSSYFVREYLNGKYGSAQEVGPYTGSLFYALDRYQAAPQIREALQAGKVVLANRFVGSNMAHQGTKFRHAEERRGYFIWLDNLEFEMLHIPRPTLSFVLRVPAEKAQELVGQKEARSYTDKTHDLHEADLEHLQKAVEVFDDMCQLFPKDFARIDCTRDSQLLDIATIHDLLWQRIVPLLPAKQAGATGSLQQQATNNTTSTPQAAYFIPSTLPPATVALYRQYMDTLLAYHTQLIQQLTAHLSDAVQARAIAAAILPVAANGSTAHIAPSVPAVATLAAQYLPTALTEATEGAQLVDVTPRNELDSIADMVFEHSNLSLAVLRQAVQTWPYTQKIAVLEAYLAANPSGTALDKIRYSWDVVSDYTTLRAAQQISGSCVALQELTPRYGYQVPTILEEASLTDLFESSFDTSLKLYSLLQEAGFPHEAQYATLGGHRSRWHYTLTARHISELTQRSQQSASLQPLIAQMRERLAEIHPVLTETYGLAAS